MEGRPLDVPGAKTLYVLSVNEDTQNIVLSEQLKPSAGNTTAAANTNITIGSGEKLWAALNRGAHTATERMQLTVAFAGAKPDTTHFAGAKPDTSHLAGAKPDTSQVSHPGHSAAERVSGGEMTSE
eukprot:COSAG02_NODE_45_length_45811_cov_83.565891_2_plen_126_part_00